MLHDNKMASEVLRDKINYRSYEILKGKDATDIKLLVCKSMQSGLTIYNMTDLHREWSNLFQNSAKHIRIRAI